MMPPKNIPNKQQQYCLPNTLKNYILLLLYRSKTKNIHQNEGDHNSRLASCRSTVVGHRVRAWFGKLLFQLRQECLILLVELLSSLPQSLIFFHYVVVLLVQPWVIFLHLFYHTWKYKLVIITIMRIKQRAKTIKEMQNQPGGWKKSDGLVWYL